MGDGAGQETATVEYDKERYKKWALPHPLVLHWVLNPGIAFNELVLGQRLPKVTLVDKESDGPFIERGYIPCPHCQTLHTGRLWAKKNSFGHWFGYVCPTCEKNIPCLWNVFSVLILVALFPIWIFPVLLFKEKWLAFEKRRIRQALNDPMVRAADIRWVRNGVVYFGGLMWFFVGVGPQVWSAVNGKDMNLTLMLVQLPIWLGAGLAWGLVMQLLMNKKVKNAESNAKEEQVQ